MKRISKITGWKRALMVLAFTVLIIRIIGHFTPFPDSVNPFLYSAYSTAAAALSSLFPFSLGDVLYTLAALFLLYLLFLLIKTAVIKEWARLVRILTKIIYGITAFYVFFHLVWGFNYYKQPIAEIYDTQLDQLDELKTLAEVYYEEAKTLRENVPEDENGVFQFSLNNQELEEELKKSAKESLQRYPEIKFIHPKKANLKSSMYSELFSYLGVAGYFNPFTSEAQYNSKMADSKRVFTSFHETAHRWGMASEAEANFGGFLLGSLSENEELKYAASFKAMRSLLNRILYYDPEYVKDFVENRYSEGMKRDREYEIEIAMKYDSDAGDLFSLMNEAFLKLNNQEGLESYGQFVELLVGFNRRYPSN